MAALDNLIAQIEDPELRRRIKEEVKRSTSKRKFGLVFEDHLPECTPLYGTAVKKGSTVAVKGEGYNNLYAVLSINGNTAFCVNRTTKEQCYLEVDLLVPVAQFGDPIYPYLQKIDQVKNGSDDDVWHALIEADNYHALQLLTYMYRHKVDCIYIDPPYNTGSRDWKYNNNYVDGNDVYRHSKWLSFMEKRLKLAKELLNPADSVLIVTIDEKEYLHLGMLLEQMFPASTIQMISTVINPKGVSALQGFKRADEYIYFIMQGSATPASLPLENEWSPSSIKASSNGSKESIKFSEAPGWTSMMRRGSHSSRVERPGLYYAIYADPKIHQIVKVGEVLPIGKHEDTQIRDLIQILPIRSNGDEGCWQVGPQELQNRINQGRVRLGKPTEYGFVVNYLPDGEYQKVLDGIFTICGYAEDGSIIAERSNNAKKDTWVAPTQWKIASHDASAYGSILLSNILQGKRFPFPKSLYAVHDTMRFFVENKPRALIVDFFAGSGTTLHAVNLLNAEDGGHRKCIMVTNNEVSENEVRSLTKQGFKPGDDEWEKLGIARYVTWPRTVCSIEGHDINGNPLKGNYIGSDLPMADGFKANAAYFKLGFLDKNAVSLGRQFCDLVPLLWMKAGSYGECPEIDRKNVPAMMILPENKMAILTKASRFAEFKEKLKDVEGIETVYLVTDSDDNYREMIKDLKGKKTYQLYRDYLDNFKVTGGTY